jgi:hypothetical protein
MAYPVVKVEIAFADGPYVASPTWTDVTTYVREISIRRGRSDEFQDFDAGTASLTLDNRTRIFDPTLTTGTYYGNLVPRRQIKITATNNGTVYPVYRGYISGWPMSITEAGFDATVTLECYDALGLLANEELPDDLADHYIRSLSPRHYWPLTDPIDPLNYTSQRLQDYGSNPQPLSCAAGLRTSNAPGLASGLANTSCSLSETQFIEGWYYAESKMASTITTMTQWLEFGSGNDNFIFTVYGLSSEVEAAFDKVANVLYVYAYDGTTQYTYTTNVYPDENIAHHFAFITAANGDLFKGFMDGVQLGFTLTGTTAFPITPLEKFGVTPGRHQQAVLYNRELTNTEVQTTYSLSLGYVTESSGSRFDRLIGYTSFPTSLTSKSANLVATVTEISDGGPSVTSELQLLSDSEGGSLYVSKSGVVTLTARYDFTKGRSVATQATFGSGGIGIGTNINYQLTAENLRNELTMGFSGNGSIDVKDTTSIAAYGTAGGSWPTQLSTQSDAQALGTLLVSFTKSPQFIISPYEVNVEASTASWDTVLSLELLDRILLNIPQKTGSNTAAIQLLQSIEHKITPSQWSTTLNGSVRYTNVFIIGTSLIGGTDLLS